MTDQTPTPTPDPGQAPAPEPQHAAPDTTPQQDPKPSGPGRGSLVSLTLPGDPVETFGVVVGVDASGDFAYVSPLPAPVAVALDELG